MQGLHSNDQLPCRPAGVQPFFLERCSAVWKAEVCAAEIARGAPELELIENGGLTGRIKTHLQSISTCEIGA